MMSRQGRGTDARKEEDSSQRQGDVAETTKKSEYNRWLVKQQNVQMATEVREQQRDGIEFVKEKQRLHAAQGLTRQQAAMVQMKRATEAVEAYRQGNLSKGKEVAEEVLQWRMKEHAEKVEHQALGKSNVKAVKEDDKTKAALEAAAADRKAKAAETRKEDEQKAKELDDLKQLLSKEKLDHTSKVRAETADTVTDQAKRFFYEQRLEAAREIKQREEQLAKKRMEQKTQLQEAQDQRKNKVKSARAEASKSVQALKTQRANEAAKLREVKQQLAEVHKQNLQSTYAERSAAVKLVIAAGFVASPDAEGVHEGGLPSPTGGKGSPSTTGRSSSK